MEIDLDKKLFKKEDKTNRRHMQFSLTAPIEHVLSLAPCPPPTLVSLEDFQAFARKQSLQECEIEYIARKCHFIHKPDVTIRPVVPTTQYETIPPYTVFNVTDKTASATAFADLSWVFIVIISLVLIGVVVCIIIRVMYRREKRKRKGYSPTKAEAVDGSCHPEVSSIREILYEKTTYGVGLKPISSKPNVKIPYNNKTPIYEAAMANDLHYMDEEETGFIDLAKFKDNHFDIRVRTSIKTTHIYEDLSDIE